AIAPLKHPLARKRLITLRRLCEEPFIVRETGSNTKSLVERALAERGLAVTPVLTLGSTEAIKCAVAAGLGVAIVSSLAAGPELKTRKVVRLNVTGLSITRDLHHLRASTRRESKAAHA